MEELTRLPTASWWALPLPRHIKSSLQPARRSTR